MPGFTRKASAPEARMIERRQYAAANRCQAALRHIDPYGNGEIRMTFVAVLEVCADYLEGLEVRGKTGRVRRPGVDTDELLSALSIEVGSQVDRRAKVMREDMLKLGAIACLCARVRANFTSAIC